jgi:DNA mismatch repair protein MutS
MTFHSILFEQAEACRQTEPQEVPDFFVDLNLDQVIDAVTAGKQEYNLKPFYYTALQANAAIQYRHEIFQALENKSLFGQINTFAQKMRMMREQLTQAEKLYYSRQKQSWFLDAVEMYCEAVNSLVHDLSLADVNARGLLAFRTYLTRYAQSEPYMALLAETKKLKADLASVQYCLLIKGNRIQVRHYEAEGDYSAEVEETFAKFKQGAVKDYRATFANWPDMNHVEAKILDLVAQLYPEIFAALSSYYVNHTNYLDDTIAVFDREIQFYIAYLEYVARFKQAGLAVCYPSITTHGKDIYQYAGFDLALANKRLTEQAAVVCNDFYLKGKERIIVVSGPNQGGKTTFARMFGQAHYLASLGCPVAGKEAQLFLFDKLFTHFEKEEDIKNLRGKLEDDLVRIHTMLTQATTNSILIMNEIFTSTTLQDAIFLGKKIMENIIQLDLLCVCVTFIDELATFSEKTVSMVSTVVPENPALRTYKIVRRPADGLAYALTIAEKYQLTYACIKERLRV